VDRPLFPAFDFRAAPHDLNPIGDDWESGLSAAPHPGRRLRRGSEGWGRRDAGESRKGSLALPFPPLELLSKDEFESIHQAALTNCATLDPDSMSPREAHAALYALKGEMTDPQVLAATMLAAFLYVVLPGASFLALFTLAARGARRRRPLHLRAPRGGRDRGRARPRRLITSKNRRWPPARRRSLRRDLRARFASGFAPPQLRHVPGHGPRR